MTAFPGGGVILGLLFWVALAATVVGASIAVLSARIIRSVSGLALCSVGLAGLYYFLRSPFLALMQVLIYIGAVCVTIVFAVMLAEPDEPGPEGARRGGWVWALGSLGAAAMIFWGLSRLVLSGGWPEPGAAVNDGSLRAMGVALLTTYSLPFELISVVLLVAILGALVVAHGGREHE